MSLVVNYDMPVTTAFEPDYETYLHRIGRCGRFGKIGMKNLFLYHIFNIELFFSGYTFNLIGSEKEFNIMKQIEEYFSHPIKYITIEGIAELASD